MKSPDWTEVTRALDPYRVLGLGELQTLYVPPEYSPSAQILRELKAWQRQNLGSAQTAPPPKFIFCGARGSGKSTQLRYLWQQLAKDNEVLLLDIASVLLDRASTAQLVAHVGLALLARLAAWEGEDGGVARVLNLPEAKGFESVLRTFAPNVDMGPLVSGIAPLLVATEVLNPTLGAAAVAAGTVWSALQKVLSPVQTMARAEKLMRPLDGAELGSAEALVEQVSGLATLLHGRSGKPVVILLDGLDKTLRLADLLVAFDDVQLLRGLEAAMVITGPTNLRHDVRFAGMRQDLKPMPHQNFPVVTVEGEDRDEGIDAMVRIATARLGGNTKSVEGAALRLAGRWSSGMPREFLRLVRDAALLAEELGHAAVTEADVRRVGKELRLTLQQPLTQADMGLLSRVLVQRRVGDTPREQELLFENIIACYPNDNAYFRPHELLVDWVRSESARLGALDLDV